MSRLLPSLSLFAVVIAGCAVAPPPEAKEPIALDGRSTVLDGERYLEYRVGVNVNASPEEVWAVLTAAEDYPDWNSTVVSLEGVIAKGEEIKLKSTVDPKRTFELEVSTFEPAQKLVWEDGNNAFRGVRTFIITAREDGTTDVTMAEVLSGSMMGMIEGKLPDFRPSFDAFAADLKRESERRTAPEAGGSAAAAP